VPEGHLKTLVRSPKFQRLTYLGHWSTPGRRNGEKRAV